jgi:hypothetical protein
MKTKSRLLKDNTNQAPHKIIKELHKPSKSIEGVNMESRIEVESG